MGVGYSSAASQGGKVSKCPRSPLACLGSRRLTRAHTLHPKTTHRAPARMIRGALRPRALLLAAATAGACFLLLGCGVSTVRADPVVGKWNRIVLDAMVAKRIGEKMVSAWARLSAGVCVCVCRRPIPPV